MMTIGIFRKHLHDHPVSTAQGQLEDAGGKPNASVHLKDERDDFGAPLTLLTLSLLIAPRCRVGHRPAG